MKMLISELLQKSETSYSPSYLEEDLHITEICVDSRIVHASDLFVAIPCPQIMFNIQHAMSQGCRVILSNDEICSELRLLGKDLMLISVKSPRLALAKLCAVLYPKQPKVNVAITGTNGKTSIVNLVRQIWESQGLAAASLGTLGLEVSSNVKFDKNFEIPKLTTLDPISLHKTLQNLSKQGIDHLAFEASSHGLDQYRLHGVKVKAAGFTNLTQDHLDYHLTMEKYLESKLKLFSEVLDENGTAVLNFQSPYFKQLSEAVRSQSILSYGVDVPANIVASKVKSTMDQLHFNLKINDKDFGEQSVKLVGHFQIENILCAIGLAIASGLSPVMVVKSLANLSYVTGRMEYIGMTQGEASIYIDYAHTPDALKHALESLRSYTSGKLWVLFGCGGNRDVGKRSLMGKIANDLADNIIVTDDNPRDEDPSEIRKQVLKDCPKGLEIENRGQAISMVLSQLQANDVLLIAGKGHETGQIIGDKVYPFDDRVEVLRHIGNDLRAV